MSPAPLKILVTADAVGGVWQYSVDLARSLAAQGVETILAVLGPSPSPAQLKTAGAVPGVTLVDTGLPLDWMAAGEAPVRAAGKAIAELAERHQVDVVQLNTPALAAEAEFPVPVVAVAHSCLATWWSAVKGTEVDPDFRWQAELTGEGMRRADRVVAPTAAFAHAVASAYGLPTVPMCVHNGRSPLPLPRVAPHDFAFTAGRLWDKGKNAATLDRAAADLPGPLYAAGPADGPNGDSIRLEHARPLGTISEKELGRWLAARPVFVSSALYEPFGLAVLEAAAAGCPLVLSDIPTFRELWDGVARFVPAMDAPGFARAIGDIAGDDFLRAEMGEAARRRASAFTPEAMAGKMLTIYRQLAGSRAGRKTAQAAA